MKQGTGGLSVCCRVAGPLVGINLDRLQEIDRLTPPACVPRMPEWLRRLLSLRGEPVESPPSHAPAALRYWFRAVVPLPLELLQLHEVDALHRLGTDVVRTGAT